MSAAGVGWLAGRRAMVVGASAAAAEVAERLSACGATSVRAEALTDAPAIVGAFADAEMGGIVDILVHAGVPMPRIAAEDMDLAAWRATQSADLDSRFLFMAEYARRKRAGNGAGAVLLLLPAPSAARGRVAAMTAHGALDNLVKSLAVEWARDGIRVNAIASNVVEHPETATAAQIASLGHLACYLVSDYAAYVTGSLMGISEI